MSTCDRCGTTISSSDMYAHQRGRRCLVDAWHVKMDREGYARVPHPYGNILRNLGYEPRHGPTYYDAGFRGRMAKVTYGDWAPQILVSIIACRTQGVPSFVGPVKLPLKSIKQRLRVVIRSLTIPRLEN